MRTKTLLMTAALSAAGILASKAQVYSVNAVGYINLDLPTGFSMIANQLNNGDNTLNTVLKDAPLGTTIYKFVNGTFSQSSTYIPGVLWTPNLTLKPGEGAFIQLSAPAKFTLVGEVPQGTAAAPLTQAIPSGFSIQSSQVPQSAPLNTMSFPADTGDTVYFFRSGNYTGTTFITGVGFNPPLQPNVGEAFFVQKGAAGNWNRIFSVN